MWVGSDEDGPSVDRSAVLQFPLEEYPERDELGMQPTGRTGPGRRSRRVPGCRGSG